MTGCGLKLYYFCQLVTFLQHLQKFQFESDCLDYSLLSRVYTIYLCFQDHCSYKNSLRQPRCCNNRSYNALSVPPTSFHFQGVAQVSLQPTHSFQFQSIVKDKPGIMSQILADSLTSATIIMNFLYFTAATNVKNFIFTLCQPGCYRICVGLLVIYPTAAMPAICSSVCY